MKMYTIEDAKAEAERFLAAVDALEKRRKSDDDFRSAVGIGVGFRETAALRRASMDLTRALADMRKP